MANRYGEMLHDLSQDGYAVTEGFLSQAHVAALASVAQAEQHAGRLEHARTGKVKTENESLRGDSIGWLDDGSTATPVVDCLASFEALRRVVNEQLFMNLHELESHLAIYPPGAVYRRHLDQFATGPQTRQLSLILYLNDGWLSSNGGALRLYLGDDSGSDTDRHVDVLPTSGRLVLFQSSRFWHEVLPSNRPRVSLAGWFRSRTLF